MGVDKEQVEKSSGYFYIYIDSIAWSPIEPGHVVKLSRGRKKTRNSANSKQYLFLNV